MTEERIELRYRDRQTGKLVTEAVFLEAGLRWFYENPLGWRIFNYTLNNYFICWLHSKWQDRPGSRKKILKFASEYQINLSEAELQPEAYPNFNAFFARKLKPGSRCFPRNSGILPAPADGKILVFPKLAAETLLPIKGTHKFLATLLSSPITAKQYLQGSALIIRLAPPDYHRFHFPDDGIAYPTQYIPGKYHSVNPIALAKVPDLFCQNQRAITKFISQQFGEIIYIEIGAFCIGTIKQTFAPGTVIQGQEKGYFRFGGSTIILLFEPGIIQFDDDLIQDSAMNLEIKVKAGEAIAKRMIC
ncbi:phosphatidylserine decarboxylase [Calothrix sp. 336/3]|uniref:phosphatidylserine decarboxylase n=1 Tax=Calothrix sp. 336/3 TaxID=1337936 RepID=UPI0004E41F03|nr:phosphatidylserine decarboxylase [Calothrix sp. 336/3]AKG20845.1 hypothetical protein IJ00_05585 [Calothrix sp. 336/3]